MVGVGVEQLAQRTLARLDAVIDRLAGAYRTVPEYGALSEGALEAEVLPVSREIIEAFLRAVSEGREPRVEHLGVLEAMGRRRLEMGVPLEPMLHVYRIAGREVFDEIAAVSGDGDKDGLAALGRAWMDYIDRASSAAASSYLHASHERLRRIDAQRGALLDSLLAADDTSDAVAVAARFAVVLAPRYVPVLVAGPDVATHVDRITRAAPVDSLSGFRGSQVVILAPDVIADPASLIAGVPGAVLARGRAAEPGAVLAGEVRRVEGVLAAAVAHGRTGCFGPDDLLLEQLVAASPTVAATLRQNVVARFRAADRGGIVESTLRAYLRTGSIPRTASAEMVHPNTVSYRLRAVAARTGLDPRIPDDAAVLLAALLAADAADL